MATRDRASIRRRAMVAVMMAAGVLHPTAAFACWQVCTGTFGYLFEANGTFYELQSCTQTWPDDSNEPHTVCHYKNIFREQQ
jgi:hypothetical protein